MKKILLLFVTCISFLLTSCSSLNNSNGYSFDSKAITNIEPKKITDKEIKHLSTCYQLLSITYNKNSTSTGPVQNPPSVYQELFIFDKKNDAQDFFQRSSILTQLFLTTYLDFVYTDVSSEIDSSNTLVFNKSESCGFLYNDYLFGFSLGKINSNNKYGVFIGIIKKTF